MSKEVKVVDGADRRKARLLELLHYIHTKGGATHDDCCAFMTLRFGLRTQTTAQYLQDLHLAKVIMLGGASHIGKYFTTGTYKQMAKLLYGE